MQRPASSQVSSKSYHSRHFEITPAGCVLRHDSNWKIFQDESSKFTWNQFVKDALNLSEQFKDENANTVIFLHIRPSYHFFVCLMGCLLGGKKVVPFSYKFPFEQLIETAKAWNVQTIIKENNKAGKGLILFKVDGEKHTKLIPSYHDRLTHEVVIPFHSQIIFLTSGSTGKPKGIVHSFDSLIEQAYLQCKTLNITSNDQWALSLPVNHTGGLMIFIRALSFGLNILLPSTKKLNSSDRIRHFLTGKDKANILSLVPTQIYDLLNEKTLISSLQKLKLILVGGALIKKYQLQFAWQNKIPLAYSYGMTETGGMCTYLAPYSPLDKIETSGKLLSSWKISKNSLPLIEISGPGLYKEYFSKINKVDHLNRKTTFFKTSDLGRLDEDGYLTIFGRHDSIFISGGENILPSEIERHLTKLDFVNEAVVIPIDHERLGKIPLGFIEVNAKFKQNQQNSLKIYWERLLRDKLPHFKIPHQFVILPKDNQLKDLKYSKTKLLQWFQKFNKKEQALRDDKVIYF